MSILRVEEEAMWSSGYLLMVEFEVIMLQRRMEWSSPNPGTSSVCVAMCWQSDSREHLGKKHCNPGLLLTFQRMCQETIWL
jgi:hypothetical protein